MTANPQVKPAKPIRSWIIFWAGTLLLFSIVHFTDKRMAQVLAALFDSLLLEANKKEISSYIGSVRGLLFFLSVAFLSLPILRDSKHIIYRAKPVDIIRNVLIALGIAVCLAILSFNPGNQAMGAKYAEISEHPFLQGNSRYSARLFMPALAYFLFLRGNWLYTLFSLTLTVGLIALLYSWNQGNGKLNLWQFLSLCTGSFVLFQFHSGGYPDVLVFIFYLLVIRDDFSEEAKLTLLVMALATHEASLFIGAVLAWRYLPRGKFIAFIASFALYMAIWLTATGFNIGTFGRYEVSDQSGIAWVLQAPQKELLGVFIAFKALWVAALLGIALGFHQKRYVEAKFILFSMLAGILMTFLGVDTSRLMGFAFPGLLAALSVIHQTLPGRLRQTFFTVLFLLNIALPSFTVGLNAQVAFAPGLYQWLYSWLETGLENMLFIP